MEINKGKGRIYLFIIVFLLGCLITYIYDTSICYNKIQDIYEQKMFEVEGKTNPLIEILDYEISNAKNYFEIKNISPVCLDYALYYNTSLRKYDGMDIRFPRRIDICNKGAYCEGLHTYLLINSHHSSCILDQTRYACLLGKLNYTGV